MRKIDLTGYTILDLEQTKPHNWFFHVKNPSSRYLYFDSWHTPRPTILAFTRAGAIRKIKRMTRKVISREKDLTMIAIYAQEWRDKNQPEGGIKL